MNNDTSKYWYSVLHTEGCIAITIHDDLGTYTENYSPTWQLAASELITELHKAGYTLR